MSKKHQGHNANEHKEREPPGDGLTQPPALSPISATYTFCCLIMSISALLPIPKHLQYTATVQKNDHLFDRPRPTVDMRPWTLGFVFSSSVYLCGMCGYYRLRQGDKYRKTFMLACSLGLMALFKFAPPSLMYPTAPVLFGILFGQMLCTFYNFQPTDRNARERVNRRGHSAGPMAQAIYFDVEKYGATIDDRVTMQPTAKKAVKAFPGSKKKVTSGKEGRDGGCEPLKKDELMKASAFFVLMVFVVTANIWLSSAEVKAHIRYRSSLWSVVGSSLNGSTDPITSL